MATAPSLRVLRERTSRLGGPVAARLGEALDALEARDWPRAEAAAQAAVGLDPGQALGWRASALARIGAEAFDGALEAYGAALALAPGDAEILRELVRLARRLGLSDMALELHAHWRAAEPGAIEAVGELAGILTNLDRLDEALEVVRTALQARPEAAGLWNELGSLASQTGDQAAAIACFGQALSLDDHLAAAWINRAVAHLGRGDPDAALADLDRAGREALAPAARGAVDLTRAYALLRRGDLAAGWAAYGARLDPARPEAMVFDIDAPAWGPGDPLEGRRLLVVGEQGLGDEVMFASVLPDAVAALGDESRLVLAVEPRLTALFQRGFPSATVLGHQTVRVQGRDRRRVPALAGRDIDLWAPLGAMVGALRGEISRFEGGRPFLRPDPARVDHWRGLLAALPGRKVGVIWRSLKMTGARKTRFSPFEDWAGVFATPGITFVNLQTGDSGEELARAEAEFGVEIFQPPGLDLTGNLDEVAALCGALDLVVGFPTATTNLAAACGAETWMICAPDAWPMLGTDRLPWYPGVRAWRLGLDEAWSQAMGRVAAALGDWARPDN